jgi:hypothetical protein
MEICIDFDGTCVTHDYPRVGRDIGAVPVLKELVKNRHLLILFTMRSSKQGVSPVTRKIEKGGIEDAIKWFAENDIPLYGIQINPGQQDWTSSPKAYGQLYIDDSALGCPLIYPEDGGRPFVDWVKAREILVNRKIIK